jgi:serine/threonine protein kinase
MLFMAWGGECLYEYTPSISSEMLEAEKQRSLDEVAGLGVLHKDLRLANMLWNKENQRVMLIDFERSVVSEIKRHKEPSHILNKLLPNAKRPRLLENKPERDTSVSSLCQPAQILTLSLHHAELGDR